MRGLTLIYSKIIRSVPAICPSTVYVCMYLAGRNFGNLIHIYVNIINAHTGKRSYSANLPQRVFPKRQKISEENYITCAVDTAVVTVFVQVEDEWQDASGLLAI